jgi:hypothetical protein
MDSSSYEKLSDEVALAGLPLKAFVGSEGDRLN